MPAYRIASEALPTRQDLFPNGDQADDSFAALLPTGNVLVEGDSGTLYEFDGTKLNTESHNVACTLRW